MDTNRCAQRRSFNLDIVCGFVVLFTIRVSKGLTTPGDVAAINSLYVALGSPLLPGWVASGGDPCSGLWQGVICEGSSISSITLNGANLGGMLGDGLGGFSSIKSITLNNNHIGGSIPSKLPATLNSLFLSDNKLTGSIPTSLSSLRNLSAMSLNANGLTGVIPDAFGGLQALVNLDLSRNNLSGPLPPSMKKLSALTTLHLQNNLLSGTLDVLQDLPLKDLDIRNNLFLGPIPPKMLGIPTFLRDGNPFNIAPSPLKNSPAATPAPAPAPALSFPPGASPRQKSLPPEQWPPKRADGPSTTKVSDSKGQRKSSRTKRIAWISIGALFSFILLILAIMFFMQRCLKERREAYRDQKRHEIIPYIGRQERSRDGSVVLLGHDDKASQLEVVRVKEDTQREVGSIPNTQNGVKQQNATAALLRNSYDTIIYDTDVMETPPPPPLPSFSPEKDIGNPIIAHEITVTRALTGHVHKNSVRAYTIASLQEYTNSFSQESLIGGGMLGNVYRAELPNGKLLAIKKLDKNVVNQMKDDKFIELVNSIHCIQHANVVELMGYCSEQGEKLLIYEYCSNGTLQDALHFDNEYKRKLPWNTRIRIALGAARALMYLHEVCEPPIIHMNFKSANILLGDELDVLVSDCGLAPLTLSRDISKLSGQLLTRYGDFGPEFESGMCTVMSDVYSFGVVMLELLTGRMPYDGSRGRGERVLVRWAIPQLHDIDALSRMVDPALEGKYRVQSLSHFADIISRCVLAEPEFRPPMSEVVQDLMQLLQKESQGRWERR